MNTLYRRTKGDITLSSVGIGTYLGHLHEAADKGYQRSVLRAIRGGLNLVDTSLNYRHQRSERSIGAALAELVREDQTIRQSIVVCTKAGYLVPDAMPDPSRLEIVGGMHCLSPEFLRDQIERSRSNMLLETIDIFYLHNPETQLEHVAESEFYRRIRAAFETMEQLAADGVIQWYGAATWNGFRQAKGGLDLRRMEQTAREVAGVAHRFRFIQLPFNLAMLEALSLRDAEGRNVLDAAGELGIDAIGSASLLQSRLAGNLPPVIRERVKGLETDAQRSLQFARSAPGLTAALVGMGNPAHVDENLAVAAVPPLSAEQFAELFR